MLAMHLLLAGLPVSVPVTVNRLCASGMEAGSAGARMINQAKHSWWSLADQSELRALRYAKG